MIALKALILLLANIGIGCFYVWLIMAFLFLPRRRLRVFGKLVPFTPGYLWRKKVWLFHLVNRYIDDFLYAAVNEEDTESVVCAWEQRAWKATWERLATLEQSGKIPAPVARGLRRFISQLAYELTRQALRNLVPYLMEHYKARSWLDLAEQKLDVAVVMAYAQRYVFKYLYLFMLALCGLIGLFNVVVYLLLQLF
ncbi:MAG: hypothetical protein K8R90_02815 [Candidatus Cloacimonetes bacterium]|nr:hypothetical protein [Candidatus Cloacimonadota bacterium]